MAEIGKITEGMRGREVSELLDNNFRSLNTEISDINGQLAERGYVIVAYAGSVENTRLSVPKKTRRAGLTITYNPGSGYLQEQYKSADTDDEAWKNDSNWLSVNYNEIREIAEKADAAAENAIEIATEAGNEAKRIAAEDGAEAKRIATEAKQTADAASENANDTAEHPTYIGADYYVYRWNKDARAYNKTDIYCKGDAFSVKKVYDSVAALEADNGNPNIKDGDFVLVNTNDVEDPDNAKLYVKNNGEYEFLVDMSGAIGFTGKTPQFSIGIITTLEAGAEATATISEDGTDSDGNPKYKINIAIPRGNPGAPFKVAGQFETLELLKQSIPDGSNVDGMIAVGAEKPYDYYAWVNGDWMNQGKIEGVTEAPTDGKAYARKNLNWVETVEKGDITLLYREYELKISSIDTTGVLLLWEAEQLIDDLVYRGVMIGSLCTESMGATSGAAASPLVQIFASIRKYYDNNNSNYFYIKDYIGIDIRFVTVIYQRKNYTALKIKLDGECDIEKFIGYFDRAPLLTWIPYAEEGGNGEVIINEEIYSSIEEMRGKELIGSSDALTKKNTTPYTPTSSYHPATKKYVDDKEFFYVIDNDTYYATLSNQGEYRGRDSVLRKISEIFGSREEYMNLVEGIELRRYNGFYFNNYKYDEDMGNYHGYTIIASNIYANYDDSAGDYYCSFSYIWREKLFNCKIVLSEGNPNGARLIIESINEKTYIVNNTTFMQVLNGNKSVKGTEVKALIGKLFGSYSAFISLTRDLSTGRYDSIKFSSVYYDDVNGDYYGDSMNAGNLYVKYAYSDGEFWCNFTYYYRDKLKSCIIFVYEASNHVEDELVIKDVVTSDN